MVVAQVEVPVAIMVVAQVEVPVAIMVVAQAEVPVAITQVTVMTIPRFRAQPQENIGMGITVKIVNLVISVQVMGMNIVAR